MALIRLPRRGRNGAYHLAKNTMNILWRTGVEVGSAVEVEMTVNVATMKENPTAELQRVPQPEVSHVKEGGAGKG